jgi:hypothetical protein
MATLEEAQAAKAKLVKMVETGEVRGVYGVGLAVDTTDGFSVSVDLSLDETVLVPEAIDGVPLTFTYISRPRAY